MISKINIRVSPLTRCIMQEELPQTEDGMLQIDHSSIYYDHILLKNANQYRYALQRADSVLTDEVTVLVNIKSTEVSEYIGMYLYKLHKLEMFKWMHRFNLSGYSAMEGLRNFYDHFNIEDDVFDSDSAYRMYLRYKKDRKVRKRMTVTSEMTKYSSKLLKDSELKRIYRTIARSIDDFYYNNGKPMEQMYRYLYVYVLYAIGRRRYTYISKKCKMPVKSVYNAINKIKEYLEMRPDVREIVDHYV